MFFSSLGIIHNCISTYLPREWTETKRLFTNFKIFHCIDTYPPREGPETFPKECNVLQSQCIVTYRPREGPETLYFIISSSQRNSYRYLSTSRGAGNSTNSLSKSYAESGIDTCLPREGPETDLQVILY